MERTYVYLIDMLNVRITEVPILIRLRSATEDRRATEFVAM